MSQRNATFVCFATVLTVLFFSNVVMADDEVILMIKGQTVVRFMSPGDTIVVYYAPDGTFPTLSAREPVRWWLTLLFYGEPRPVTIMSVYVQEIRNFNLLLLGSHRIGPWKTHVSLSETRGQSRYKIVIKNNVVHTPVLVSIK